MKFSDRIKELDDDIREMNKNIDLIDAAHKQATTSTGIFINELKGKPKKKEFYLVFNKLSKEMMYSSNEWFRLNIEIIRKFSINTAKILNNDLTIYENSNRELGKLIIQYADNLSNRIKGENLILELNNNGELFTQLDKKTKLCRQIIKDTLDRIRNFDS